MTAGMHGKAPRCGGSGMARCSMQEVRTASVGDDHSRTGLELCMRE